MPFSCLKLLLALTLFVIITECRIRKICKDDNDCGPGFGCIQTPRKGKMCARTRVEDAKTSKYKTTDYKSVNLRYNTLVCWADGTNVSPTLFSGEVVGRVKNSRRGLQRELCPVDRQPNGV